MAARTLVRRPLALALSLLPALMIAQASRAAAQTARPRDVALQRLLVAEDARGTGADSIAPIIAGLTSGDTLIRRVAVRGAGRLQRPELVPTLVLSLGDAVPSIRAEAASAIVQSIRHLRRAPATDPGIPMVAQAVPALLSALAAERDAPTAGAIADAIGRLPVADSASARTAERAIRERAGAAPSVGALHGLYTLALTRRQTGNLTPETIALLATAARTAPDPSARRLAVLALGIAGGLDSATAVAASHDRDDQVRRLALAAVPRLAPGTRAEILARAFRDTSLVVRVGAVAISRAAKLPAACAHVVAATSDRHPYVALMALDSIGAVCPADTARGVLRAALDRPRSGLAAHAWQAPAHALVALTRVDTAAAIAYVAGFATSARWQERLYAARAAAALGDTAGLVRFAADRDDNVREAAVAGLARISKHAADGGYVAALGARGNQAVLAAAEALAGSRDTRAVPALLDALDRLTALRTENARDPRVMILRRVDELGTARDSTRLLRYVADFDTTVAAAAAATLSRWTGRRVAPRAERLPIAPEPLAAVFRDSRTRLRVTLARASGGGTFVVRLFPDEAPATVARILRLARERYYEGVVLHRVEPNFVVQGGGPGASEYIGHPRFMRDELGSRSHLRGTLGISSRGRDTGDAQWFLNLADNPLLDHEYTVFGEVVEGRGVAERILEGDAIARVEVVGGERR